MEEQIKGFIKPLVFIAVVVFLICFFVKRPLTIGDYISYIGYGVTIDTLVFVAYEKWLWCIFPLNRPYILKKYYQGIIRYEYNGVPGEKKISVKVMQSRLTLKIETKTDINSSVTISARIVSEFGKHILYYIYLTNPSALSQSQNPIQYGTCRMVLEGDNSKIIGKYWTSSRTMGDIEWTEVSEKE